MTVAEIQREAEGIQFRYDRDIKDKAFFDYQLAQLIGMAVGSLFSKNSKFPEIEKVYPGIYPEAEEKEIDLTDISVIRFMQFAQQYNKNLKEVN